MGAWYIQDAMRVRSNLTVQVGLRHEFDTGWNEEAGESCEFLNEPARQRQSLRTAPADRQFGLHTEQREMALQPSSSARMGSLRGWVDGRSRRIRNPLFVLWTTRLSAQRGPQWLIQWNASPIRACYLMLYPLSFM